MPRDTNITIDPPPRNRIRAEILAKMAEVPLRRRVDDVSPAGEDPSSPAPVSPIDVSRRRLGVICLLAPEHIPSTTALERSLSAAVRARCLAALDLGTDAIEGAIEALRTGLPPTPRRAPGGLRAMIAEGALADFKVHDGFFNIVRAGFSHPAAYVRSSLQALLFLREELREAPTSLKAEKLTRIEEGLSANVTTALGADLRASAPPCETVEEAALRDHAGRRWIRGHQIFAALTQGLVFAIEGLDAATARNSPEARAAAAEHLILGLDACAAALELTGDFPAEIYENLIRPSMSQPHLPKGFSGLLSADHCHLVRRMKATRPAMERLRDEDPIRHGGVVAALAGVYDSHRHVCSRFVGTDKSSLLMNTECGRSSVEQLERFKATRLRNLG